MMEATLPRFLLIGLDTASEQSIKKLGFKVEFVNQSLDLERLMEEVLSPLPLVILCGASKDEEIEMANELAQILRMNYQNAPIFYVTTNRAAFNRSLLVKNGFNDAFLIPSDVSTLSEELKMILAQSKNAVFYKSVSMVDIAPGETLGFDIFLHMPMNGKHIRFASGKEPLDEKRAQRLHKHKVDSVHVSMDQIQEFYKFTANQLKKLGAGHHLSETEKREQREKAIRNLMGGLFQESTPEESFKRGKALLEDCKEIIKNYIGEGKEEKNDWYSKLMKTIIPQNTLYSHASNVSTYAALFSLGLSIGEAEDMALAGLLHDIGLTDVPPEIVAKSEEERTPEEQARYMKHSEHSLRLIQERKLILSPKVLKAIEQHHERFDGNGPNKVPGDRISKEAELLAFADFFDHALNDSLPIKTPQQVVNELHQQLINNPSQLQFSPDFIKKVLHLFPSTENDNIGEIHDSA